MGTCCHYEGLCSRLAVEGFLGAGNVQKFDVFGDCRLRDNSSGLDPIHMRRCVGTQCLMERLIGILVSWTNE